MDAIQSVCVIGCGAAGLACVRHLSQRNHQLSVDAYEQTNTIGGQWNYSDNVGDDCNGLPLHSSMYKNMRYSFVLIVRYIFVYELSFI
jgi:cation diffusion facilitator CzcD-associated flavoprotein CzcO